MDGRDAECVAARAYRRIRGNLNSGLKSESFCILARKRPRLLPDGAATMWLNTTIPGEFLWSHACRLIPPMGFPVRQDPRRGGDDSIRKASSKLRSTPSDPRSLQSKRRNFQSKQRRSVAYLRNASLIAAAPRPKPEALYPTSAAFPPKHASSHPPPAALPPNDAASNPIYAALYPIYAAAYPLTESAEIQ